MIKNKDGGDRNSGVVETKAKGGTIIQTFGLDRSSIGGGASDERGGKMGGGKDDLSHSLSGNSVAKAPSR